MGLGEQPRWSCGSPAGRSSARGSGTGTGLLRAWGGHTSARCVPEQPRLDPPLPETPPPPLPTCDAHPHAATPALRGSAHPPGRLLPCRLMPPCPDCPPTPAHTTVDPAAPAWAPCLNLRPHCALLRSPEGLRALDSPASQIRVSGPAPLPGLRPQTRFLGVGDPPHQPPQAGERVLRAESLGSRGWLPYWGAPRREA